MKQTLRHVESLKREAIHGGYTIASLAALLREHKARCKGTDLEPYVSECLTAVGPCEDLLKRLGAKAAMRAAQIRTGEQE